MLLKKLYLIIHMFNVPLKLSFITLAVISCFFLNSCKSVDAKKYPPDPRERVKKNLEEGRGFRLNEGIDKIRKKGGGNFEFASSNELWRASLDIIDFMPLASANYSGGIIITDWYTDGSNPNQTVKITIRFLSNEIRSDAIDIKVYQKDCNKNFECKISQQTGVIQSELRKEILKKATLYKKENKDKDFKPYVMPSKKSPSD